MRWAASALLQATGGAASGDDFLTRLAAIEASRRLLVLVSDGAPMETATSGANRLGFLDDHLAAVAAALDARHDVEVGALTLDADLSGIFCRSRSIDLDGTLSLGHYEVLADLFG